MKLITRQTAANEAAENWMRQYPKDKNGIGAKLKAMGDNPDPDAVDALIGNGTWTRVPECDECGADGVPVVRVGEEPGYGRHTANLCKSCLTAALQITRER